MNIENRLTKLEAAANVNSENCACTGGLQFRAVGPDWEHTEEQFQLLLAEAHRPETCEQCGKLIDKQVIVIEGV